MLYDGYEDGVIIDLQNSIESLQFIDSYIKVDLTNATSDQVFALNAKLNSSENYKYIYITTNDKDVDYSVFLNNRNKSLLFYNSYRENSYYVSGNSIYYDYHDFYKLF